MLSFDFECPFLIQAFANELQEDRMVPADSGHACDILGIAANNHARKIVTDVLDVTLKVL